MTRFLPRFLLVSLMALPHAFASFDEKEKESRGLPVLVATFGKNFCKPTDEDLAALPTEDIDVPGTFADPQHHPEATPTEDHGYPWIHLSSHGTIVKVELKPTDQPLSLKTLCDALKAGHGLSVAFEYPLASYRLNIWAFVANGTNRRGMPIENCFKVTYANDSIDKCFYLHASRFSEGTVAFITWPHKAYLSMQGVAESPGLHLIFPHFDTFTSDEMVP